MDNKNKKRLKYFKITLTIFFIAYASLYILNMTGYYEGNIRKRVSFTTSQIEEFEQDIANGKNIDLNDYLKDQNKDYSNNASRLGYSISKNIDLFLNKGIKDILDILSKLLS